MRRFAILVVSGLWLAAPAVAQPVTSCQSTTTCERECEAGAAAACTRAGRLSSGDWLRAVALLQRGCERGDGAGCAELSELFRAGKGVKPDAQRAFRLQTQACERRHAPSCLSLARAYEASAAGLKDAPRINQELGRATLLFLRACEAGAAEACGDLSRLYLWGAGVKVDALGGAVLAQRACDKGDFASCRLLGHLYEVGLGVQKDGLRASDLYRKAKNLPAREKPLVVPPLPVEGAGRVTITTDPAGALVFVDTLSAGAGPVTVHAPPGEHVVQVTLSGQQPQTKPVRVEAGKTAALVFAWPGTLRVEPTPANASVVVDGAHRGRGRWEGQLPAGEHTLVLEAPGFMAASRQVVVKAGELSTEKVNLASAPGTLQVETTPPGATISINGAQLGVTPWSGEVPPGKTQLTLALAGHLTVKKTLQLKAGVGAEEKVTLAPELVALSLKSTPGRASVILDGKPTGTTPWNGKVPVGRHSLAVELDGYEAVSEALELVSGTPRVARTLKLVEKPTLLRVESVPAGAEVSVDETRVGVSPWEGPVTPGAHSVSARLAGYRADSVQVELKRRTTSTSRVELQVTDVEVLVETTPVGASVIIDGIERGTSPLKVALPPGAHRVNVTQAGHVAVEATPELAPGVSTTWKFEQQPVVVARAEPPLLPPVTPDVPPPLVPAVEDAAQVLAGLTVTKAVKQDALRSLAASQRDLSEHLGQVEPDAVRGELCMQWRERVYPAPVQIIARDSFGDQVVASVTVNGVVVGTTPFQSPLPLCVTRIGVEWADAQPLERTVESLKPGETNTFEFQFSGRKQVLVASLFGDAAHASPGFDMGPESYFSGGLKLDFWGRWFHFSVGLKVSTMFAEILMAPVIPAADLFVGAGYAFGSDTVRFRFAIDLGVWTLVCPTVRLALSLALFERAFLTLSADAHLHPAALLPTDQRGRYEFTPLENFIFPGGTASLGFGW